MTRAEQIAALIKNVENWDDDMLLEYAQDAMTEDMSKLKDADLDLYYSHTFSYEKS